MLETLNKMFNERYQDVFDKLNANVVYAAKDGVLFDVPSVSIGKDGGTFNVGTASAYSLNPPAEINVSFKKKQPANAWYRLSIPFSECEVAAKNPAYFNYLFDRIMSKAVANYNATFGGPEAMRFGDSYCNVDGLRELPDMNIELRLRGCWASDKDAEETPS